MPAFLRNNYRLFIIRSKMQPTTGALLSNATTRLLLMQQQQSEVIHAAATFSLSGGGQRIGSAAIRLNQRVISNIGSKQQQQQQQQLQSSSMENKNGLHYKNQQSSHLFMLKAAAASGQFIVDHAYPYLKHQRLELLVRYECSDVIIIPKTVWRLMDDPKFIELSAVKGPMSGASTSRLASPSTVVSESYPKSSNSPLPSNRQQNNVEFKNSLIAKHWGAETISQLSNGQGGISTAVHKITCRVMTTEECEPSSSSIVYAPQWILNTIQIETGDRVCIHSIKDLHLRGRASKVQAVLVTPKAIKDLLFTGQETATPNMISESKLKGLILKGLWRYSYLKLGQYVKVDLEPAPNNMGNACQTSNARPIILRIVWMDAYKSHSDSNFEQPFLIGEAFTKIEICLFQEQQEAPPQALPAEDLNPLVCEILDYREHDIHQQFMEAVYNTGGHASSIANMNKWLKQYTADGGNIVSPLSSTQPQAAAQSGNASDQHLISSFYKNLNIIKEQETAASATQEMNRNLSNLARNKLKLKLQRHQKMLSAGSNTPLADEANQGSVVCFEPEPPSRVASSRIEQPTRIQSGNQTLRTKQQVSTARLQNARNSSTKMSQKDLPSNKQSQRKVFYPDIAVQFGKKHSNVNSKPAFDRVVLGSFDQANKRFMATRVVLSSSSNARTQPSQQRASKTLQYNYSQQRGFPNNSKEKVTLSARNTSRPAQQATFTIENKSRTTREQGKRISTTNEPNTRSPSFLLLSSRKQIQTPKRQFSNSSQASLSSQRKNQTANVKSGRASLSKPPIPSPQHTLINQSVLRQESFDGATPRYYNDPAITNPLVYFKKQEAQLQQSKKAAVAYSQTKLAGGRPVISRQAGASPSSQALPRGGLKDYHNLRIRQSRLSLQQTIKPPVQMNVPFFSQNSGVSSPPMFHDDPLRNQMIRQKTRTKGKIPIQIFSFNQDKLDSQQCIIPQQAFNQAQQLSARPSPSSNLLLSPYREHLRITNNSPPKKTMKQRLYQQPPPPSSNPTYQQSLRNGFNGQPQTQNHIIHSAGGQRMALSVPSAANAPMNLEGGVVSKKVHITVSISAEAFAQAARNQHNPNYTHHNIGMSVQSKNNATATASPSATIGV